MATDEGTPLAERISKLQRKLAKAQHQVVNGEGDEAAAVVAKLSKRIAKLQRQVVGSASDAPAAATQVADAADEVPAGKKSKKRKQAAAEAGSEISVAAAGTEQDAADGDVPTKKSKKDKAGVKVAAAAPAQHAQVGNAKLAAEGKPIRKQLYTESKEVAAMSAAQVDKILSERGMTVTGSTLKPVVRFEQTGLPPNMLHAVREFSTPSPIQSQCWPIILSGSDLIGIAATGSGKTLAFGLPALAHIAAQKEAGVVKGKGPFALAMAPTRELACQISDVLAEAGSKCNTKCVTVYGGVPKTDQKRALQAGVEIVVGTPGRLEDLMNDGSCNLSQVTYLVLDEADRMLDLGFEPHIRAICGHVRSDRQTLMFSATWPSAVQQLASAFLCRPVKVTVGSLDLSASHSITQIVEVIEPYARDQRLLALLSKYHSSRSNRIIIFVLYKKEAPRVEALLQRQGWKALAIHGDISQAQRTNAVERFKDGSAPLLIATDVAARGLDIPDVEVVINYSFPLTTEDYVHRIGRTGRAGKTGVAHTFFSGVSDKARSGELINVLREAGQVVPDDLLKFGTSVKKKESKLYGAHFKDVDISATATKMTFDSDDE